MKVQITDVSALRKISPIDISEYIKSIGGKFITPFKNSSIWNIKGEEILIPSSTAVLDYALVVSDILKQLEEIQQCDQLSIYDNIVRSSYDVIRIHCSSSDTENCTISATNGLSLIQNSYNLLYSAACSSATGKLYYPGKKSKIAEEYMKTVRFGQPEHGSFVLTILAPVPPILKIQLSSIDTNDIPYERTVIPTLQKGLLSLNEASLKASQVSSLDPFLDSASNGITSNLCDAVVALQDISDDGNISINISYSSRRIKQKGYTNIKIRKDYYDYIKEASKSIKEFEPEDDKTICGPIIQVSRSPESDYGKVTVQDLSGNKPKNITLVLSGDNYSTASYIHGKHGSLRATGILEKSSRQYRMQNIESVEFFENEWTDHE